MEIHEFVDTLGVEIQSYDSGMIQINHQVYTQAVTIHANQVAVSSITDVSGLELMDWHQVVEMKPEIVLLGTGERQFFLHPKITATLASQGIGVETMSTAAACRTYMILRSEGRNVWAWLLP